MKNLIFISLLAFFSFPMFSQEIEAATTAEKKSFTKS